MTPEEYVNKIKDEIDNNIIGENIAATNTAKKIANKIKAKVLGFTSNDYGEITSVSDEFSDFILEGSEKEIAILRKKIKERATAQLKNINDLKPKDIFNYTYRNAMQKIIDQERKKALVIVKKVIAAETRKQIIEPWELIAKMRGIELDK